MTPDLLTAMYAEHGLKLEISKSGNLHTIAGHSGIESMTVSQAVAFIRGVAFQAKREKAIQFECQHCGEQFTSLADGLIPTHDYSKPCRSVCPGSRQKPA